MPENDQSMQTRDPEREIESAVTSTQGRKRTKSEIKNVTEERYQTFMMLNPDSDPVESAIDIAREEAAKRAKEMITEMSADMIGVRGGFKEKFNPHSSPMGQDIRDFLKDKTRGYINKLIEDEQAKYKAEKFEEIDNSSMNDDGKKKAKEEFLNDQKVKEIYLRTSFYDIAKEDVVGRLYKQSESYADEIMENYFTRFEMDISIKCQEEFRDAFKSTMSKVHDVPEDWAQNVAKEKAIEKVVTKAKKIGKEIFEEHEDSIKKRAKEKLMKERERLIATLGGSVSENKIRAIFKGVRDFDFKAVETFVYESTDEESLESGIKSTEEIKGDIAKNLRNGDFITNDIGRTLKYISKAIFSLVNADGDSTILNLGFKIPVHEGVFITFGINGSVINLSNDIIGKIDVSVGAGGDAGLAELAGSIGGFIQIKSKNSADFANLIGYSLYRQARESKIFPHWVTNYIWGSGGRSGTSSYEEAEAYGAMSEKKLFGEGASSGNAAKLGIYGKFGFKVGVGGDAEEGNPAANITGSAKFGVSREYSKRAFEKSGQMDRLGKMEEYKMFGQKSKGQLTGDFSFNLGAAGGLGGGNILLNIIVRSGKVDKIIVQGDGSFVLPMNETATKYLVSTISNVVGVVAPNLEKAMKLFSKHKGNPELEEDELARVVVSDIGGAGFESFQAGFSGQPLSKLLENINATPEDALKANESASSIYLTLKYEWIKGKKSEFSVSLSTASAIGMNFGVGSFKVEKGKRIINWSSEDAQNTAGGLGKKAIGGFSM